MGSSLLSKLPLAEAATARTNWAGNLTYSTDHLDLPANPEEVKHLIAAHTHLKALGTRHSFNDIADSTEEQVSLQHLDSIELDTTARTVTVGAGVTYGQLAPYIDSRGFAVHNLASLPHISVVGGCATATHGSGLHNGNLSTAVRAIEIVLPDGTLKTFTREHDADFPGIVVGLGALGIITRITLAVEPRFEMTQVLYENLSFDELQHNLIPIYSSGYSVSLFTDWQHHRATQVWIKRRTDGGNATHISPQFYGATAATKKLHPISGVSAENCTDQLGVPGPWYERLPHFKMNFTPSQGAEIQSEYFVPLDRAYEAILAVEQLRDQITPHLFVTELRTIAPDDLWLSMAYQRPSLALHFTWKREWPAIKQILPQIEAKLAPFDPRPHWAKTFTMPPAQIQAHYPRMKDFKALLAKYDPKGKFRNHFLNTNLYSA
ncbi:D-arabinono-1,4-lactone oxidase [Granulicella sp. WH15]|uniref:D-arabinono-1,4-lactone oxidase n=1 Tax=Granulicella sp. WH15 TaxID=2602070 RepID=UPI002106C386|nr:D-arabinono-1,4-lactone oxidase [Granulicella sp. WH15]